MRQLILAVVSGVSATLAFGAVTNITESVRLDADADWRGQGVVKLGEGVTIDLHGHELKTDGYTGPDEPFVDATVADPDRVTSPTTIFSGNVKFLFDNDIRYSAATGAPEDESKNHRVCVRKENLPFAVVYDFGEPTCISAYRMYYKAQAEGSQRAPIDWTFFGSDDNEKWTALDSRSDQVEWSMPDIRLFSFANSRRFRYYKLNITKHGSSNCLELYQLEYFKATSGTVDLTRGTNAVSCATTLYSGDATFLFDDNLNYSASTGSPTDKSKNHRVCVKGSDGPFVVDYEFDEPVCVNAYKLYYNATTSSEESARCPKTWTLSGSNDGEEWTVVDSHERDTNWKRGRGRLLECDNVRKFKKYRLSVTAFGSDNVLELYQIEYFNRAKIVSTSEDLTEPGGTVTANKPLYGGSLADLFDNNFKYGGANANPQHRICVNKNYPFDLVYDFGEGKSAAVDAYRIYYDSSASKRSPTNWTFEGSNDTNTEWTVLDTHVDEPDWINKTIHDFEFTNAEKYRYYKFSFAKPSSDVLEMYQLEFFDRKGGVVQADIAEGTTVTNESAMIEQDVRVVKDGAGTFVDTATAQAFGKGLEINAGTYRSPTEGDWLAGPLALNGGNLAIDFAVVKDRSRGIFPSIALGADARLNIDGYFVTGNLDGSVMDLGGHTLAVSVGKTGRWDMYSRTITNGTVKVMGDSSAILHFPDTSSLDAKTVNFDFNCLYRMYTCVPQVGDLTVRVTNTTATAQTMTVYGTFKPVVAGFQDTLLADGATLDLSETAGTLPVKSVWVDKYLSFAEGAAIAVNLGDRKPRRGDCLVSWDETHAPQNVTFEIDAASKVYGYDVEARADGLYFLNNRGACILIK